VDKDQLLKDFFRSFKVTLTNAFSYSKDHPYFLKSAEDLKSKLELVLQAINPFIIGVTNVSLMADGKSWEKTGPYDELANIFHQRKIKNIQITPGAGTPELIKFLSIISLPQKDILKAGGANQILRHEGLPHFFIEELDYSSFLKEQGQEVADVWGYLLKDTLSRADRVKIDELADNFGNVLGKIREADLFGSGNLSESINDFLTYLKGNDKPKFNKCAKEVFSWLLQNKRLLNDEKIGKIRKIFEDLHEDDFMELLWEGLINEEEFDALSLQLFAKISQQGNQEAFAGNLLKKIRSSQTLKNNPRVAKKIQDLLVNPHEDSVSAVYRNTLNSLLKEITFFGESVFDRVKLRSNFRYILLSLLASGQDRQRLKLIIENMNKELDLAIEDKDLDYLRDLWEFMLTRKRDDPVLAQLKVKKIPEFVENMFWNNALPAGYESLCDRLSGPSNELNFYLEELFNAPELKPEALKLFFRFFGSDLSAFYLSLGKKRQDTEFLIKIVTALGRVDTPIALEVLKRVYSFANVLVKTEVLNAIQKSDTYRVTKPDYAFLTLVLASPAATIRKSAILVLAINAEARAKSAEILFSAVHPWGSRKRINLENLRIVQELNLREADRYVISLSHKRFFWNRQVREKASQILKERDVS